MTSKEEILSSKPLFLTEERLGLVLTELYPNETWIHDKPFSPHRFRPDYRGPESRLVVEFDGFRRYTLASSIIADLAKKDVLLEAGYTFVSIPYWLQLTPLVIQTLFRLPCEKDFSNGYAQGFIAKEAALPADYCTLGVERFVSQMRGLPVTIRQAVVASLVCNTEKKGNWRLVVPTLEFLEENFYLPAV